jgi:hypothetical protein
MKKWFRASEMGYSGNRPGAAFARLMLDVLSADPVSQPDQPFDGVPLARRKRPACPRRFRQRAKLGAAQVEIGEVPRFGCDGTIRSAARGALMTGHDVQNSAPAQGVRVSKA